MTHRYPLFIAALAVSLAGCVERGDWKPAKLLAPQGLTAQRTLARHQ